MPSRPRDIQVDITILVINWNSGGHLAKLLWSLKELGGEVSGILVLDNASEDGSAECVAGFRGIELERMERNLGFAAAVNIGFRKSDSRYVLLLNPDIWFDDPAAVLSGLNRIADGDPGAAIVVPRLFTLSPLGPVPQSGFQVRPFPDLRSTLSDLLFWDELGGRKAKRGGRIMEAVAETAEALEGQPAAACWLVRKTAWEEAGGLDERFYPAWFEDVDFCLRIRRLGWRILGHEGGGKVFHSGGCSLEVLGFRRFLVFYYHNLLRYWWKHHRILFPVVAAAAGIGFSLRLLLEIFQPGKAPGSRRR